MDIRTRIFAGIAAATLVTVAASAHAQDDGLQSNIPFEFVAGERTLARGVYEVYRADGQSNVFMDRSERGAVIVLGQPIGTETSADTAELVFHRYGDDYFLREIRFSGRRGFTVLESAQERAAAEERATARAGSHPETVVIPTTARSGRK